MNTMKIGNYVSTLSSEILNIAKDELGEDEYLRTSNLAKIRKWLKKQPHLQSARTGKAL